MILLGCFPLWKSSPLCHLVVLTPRCRTVICSLLGEPRDGAGEALLFHAGEIGFPQDSLTCLLVDDPSHS